VSVRDLLDAHVDQETRHPFEVPIHCRLLIEHVQEQLRSLILPQDRTMGRASQWDRESV
jgi:hypothetical protein